MATKLPIHIDNLGNNRPLGLIPGEVKLKWTEFGADGADTPKLIERSEWKERILELNGGKHGRAALDAARFCPPVHDQDGIGQCNADATTGVTESLRAMQGLPYVKLSAADLYNRINGGADNGSLLEDAVDAMTKDGIGTAETCGTLWHQGMKSAPQAERARFKVLEYFLCPSFDHLMSATLEGFFGVSGIWWYDNFSRVDGDGWLPEDRQGSFGGHAIEKILVADFREEGDRVSYALGHQNSWTKRWGWNGRMFIPEAAYSQNNSGRLGGWWVCREVTTESSDVPTPKPQLAEQPQPQKQGVRPSERQKETTADFLARRRAAEGGQKPENNG